MKKILFLSTLVMPFFISAKYEMIDDAKISGKILVSKSSSKYNSVEKCESYSLSKDKSMGFTYDSKESKCTLYKVVRGTKESSGSTSGISSS